MAAWHRSRRADLGLRASGLLLCGTAYTALSRLCAMPLAPDTVGALAFALAAIGLLAASAGSAMAALGHHLFDQIKVSERWQPRTHDVILPIETAKTTDLTDPALLASDTRVPSVCPRLGWLAPNASTLVHRAVSAHRSPNVSTARAIAPRSVRRSRWL